MTKADIVKSVTETIGVEKPIAEDVINVLMGTIRGALESGEPVYLRGFGSFILKERAEKLARDISRGSAIVVPSHKIPFFKPSKEFIEAVKNK